MQQARTAIRVSSVDAAEDLTAKTFLRALQRLDTFDAEKGELTAWIYGIARHLVQDHCKCRGEESPSLASGQASPALQRTVASIAARASGEPNVLSGSLARGLVLRWGLAMTAAAALLIVAIPAARASIVRQFHRVLDASSSGRTLKS